jgi:sn-glycerol 3-phosphate transport system permease protein
MIAPAITGIAIFTLYPLIDLIRLSFMKIDLMDDTQSHFIGIDNYKEVFARPDFYQTLWNTVIYTIAVVGLITSFALILAVWLNSKKGKFNSTVQAFAFLPHITSIVSISLIFLWMMEPSFGLFNYVLGVLGLPPSKWLESSSTAMGCIIGVSTWKEVGFDTLIFMAALQGVPPELYEAADLDNAGKVRKFFNITIPLISPQLFFVIIIRTIASFKVFDTVRLLTEGGPANATKTLVYAIYQEALFNVRIGYSAVYGVVLLVIICLLTIVYFKMLAKKVYYQ